MDKADALTLLSWSERIFTANTVAEVLGGKAAASCEVLFNSLKELWVGTPAPTPPI